MHYSWYLQKLGRKSHCFKYTNTLKLRIGFIEIKNKIIVKMHFRYFKFLLLFFTNSLFAQNKGMNKLTSKDTLYPLDEWFNAWELISKKVFNLNTFYPVEFVFFDDKNVYSTSVITIPKGREINGPNLFRNKLLWKTIPHNGELTLPNNEKVPIGLMSFASPIDGLPANAFFVMPLPSFWKAAGVKSEELGLEKMLTGVFLHEFSHTQQMQNFGRKMTVYEKEFSFDVKFSDDIIQDYFGNDSIYNNAFRKEVAIFYNAANEVDSNKQRFLISEALKMLDKRQGKYFIKNKKALAQVDNFFLSMEGVGQYSMYAWLVHKDGGSLSKEKSLIGVRRGGKWWSQEEGLALFLVLDKLMETKMWAGLMFGKETNSVVELIKKKL